MEITVGLFDDQENPIIGGSAYTSLKIRRVSDGFFYDWSDSSFKLVSLVTTISSTLSEMDIVNNPGYYFKNINSTFWNNDVYQAFINYSAGGLNLNGSSETTIRDGKEFDSAVLDILDVEDSIQRKILGLVHENVYIDESIYDTNNNLVSARLRIYSDSLSVGSDFNVTATYRITANCNEAGKFISWKQVKE